MEAMAVYYVRVKDVISDISNFISSMFETFSAETKSLINSFLQYILNIEKYLKFLKEKLSTINKMRMLDQKIDDFDAKITNFLSKFSELCLTQKFKRPDLNIPVASTVISTGNYPFFPFKMKMDLPIKPNFIDNWIFRLDNPEGCVVDIEESGIFLRTSLYTAKFVDYSFSSTTRMLILADFSFKKMNSSSKSQDSLILSQLNNLVMEERRRNSFELELNSENLLNSDSEPFFAVKEKVKICSNSASWPLSKDFEELMLKRGREKIVKIQEEKKISECLGHFHEWILSSIDEEKGKKY